MNLPPDRHWQATRNDLYFEFTSSHYHLEFNGECVMPVHDGKLGWSLEGLRIEAAMELLIRCGWYVKEMNP